MDPITQQTTLAAAGGKKDPVYVDDVFSTFLYEGNGGTQSINNGIDIAGEGGMVWVKNRESQYYDHQIADTERGNQYYLRSDSANGQNSGTTALTSFNNNGFSVGAAGNFNLTNNDHVSWSFRKAPGFFDVVTWTGDGISTGRNIAHSLGSVPGMIVAKRTNSTGDWEVHHRSLSSNYFAQLNSPNAATATGGNDRWRNTTPTSSVFTVGSALNASGGTYVAYIFAHDDAQFGTDENESIIKCGSVNNNGSQVTDVNLGFEPQFIIIKNSSVSENWNMFDVMRGMDVNKSSKLFPNKNNNEDTVGYAIVSPTATGFSLSTASAGDWVNGTYIYMAIRRSNKPPEAGTEVFHTNYLASNGINIKQTTPFALDLLWLLNTYDFNVFDRLRGQSYIRLPYSNAETSASPPVIDYTDGYRNDYVNGNLLLGYSFKRAPGFMDIVAYEGNGTTSNSITHDLGVAPELMIIKNRDNASYGDWAVYYKTATAGGPTKYLVLNTTAAEASTSSPGYWNATEPTSTTISLGSNWRVNGSYSYISYLFATLPGISKVGTYDGTGSDINVDCGFTNGARFVMIKRTDISGNWYAWDTVRGIVNGNETYVECNPAIAQVTNTDYIDPLNAGFTVTSSAPAGINATGGTYLFCAIA